MRKEVVTARVSVEAAKNAKLQSEKEGLSLSAYIEKVLSLAVGIEPSKPAWAIALEARVSQLESNSASRHQQPDHFTDIQHKP